MLQSELREKSLELDHIEALIAQRQKEQQKLDNQAAYLQLLSNKRLMPNKVLGVVTDSLPIDPKLSLTRLSQAEKSVLISGKSLDLKPITDWVTELETSLLFESVSVNRWETNREVFLFEILCILEE